MTKSENAVNLFKQGYNCCQAVFCAFCQDFGINLETGLKLASSFGGGMGGMREVCGAVSAMFMVLGLKYGYSVSDDVTLKKQHYNLIREAAKKFSEENGSIICKELLGISKPKTDADYIPTERNAEFFKKRPCVELVEYAALVTEQLLH
ncbi:C-GCAxxG-C-C family protein [Candidatus Ruminimicrobium bovinum]|uniref:C-GCAxxG-C-C family protein n=1 Tax=Candidatus Ruminimicrobium bovinum TaxID=3242779 RepID=UPI0039B999E0